MEDRPDTPRTSYAQNGEDVVLWRALGSISQGNYVDVGAGHPEQDSLTKSLYDSGWSGINVEPLPQHAVALRTRRPRDLTFDVGAGSAHELVPFYGILGTGLSSTLPSVVDVATHRGFTITEIDIEIVTLDSILEQRFEPGEEIHLLNISTEGTEAGVLEGVDLVRWKPWVIVVSAVEANGNTDVRGKFESLLSSHGYTAALFNGIKAFYVSPAHPELEHNLSYPPCALDNYVVAREQEAHHRLTKEVVRWQSAWAMAETGLIRNQSERSRLEAVTQTARRKARRATAQRNRIEDSLWWRLTSPGRKIGRKIGGASTSSKRPKPSASNEPPANKSPSAPPGTEHTREEVLHERIRLLLAAIEQPTTEDQPFETTLQDVVRVLGGSNQPNQLLWMLYIVFHSRYPEESEVVAAQRRLRLDGAHKTVTEMSELAVRRSPTWASNAP
ncbi:MAG: FkbM family methyltransferase, partial [Candidatus Nanopelagicales bacterium]